MLNDKRSDVDIEPFEPLYDAWIDAQRLRAELEAVLESKRQLESELTAARAQVALVHQQSEAGWESSRHWCARAEELHQQAVDWRREAEAQAEQAKAAIAEIELRESQQLKESQREIQDARRELADSEAKLASAEQSLSKSEQQLAVVTNSKTWRWTSGLRQALGAVKPKPAADPGSISGE